MRGTECPTFDLVTIHSMTEGRMYHRDRYRSV